MSSPTRLNIFVENYLAGGLERFYCDLINGLPATEFDVTLLANPIAGLADRLAAAIQRPINLQLYRAYTTTRLDYGWHQANGPGRSPLLRRMSKLATRWPLREISRAQLRRVLRQHPAQVLHIINGGYPGAAGCLLAAQLAHELRLPRVLMSVLSYPYPRRRAWDAALDRAVGRSVHGISPNSAIAGQGLIALREFPAHLIRSIPSGTTPPPIDLAAGARLRTELGLPAGSVVIGTVAALEPLKGHLVLLDAARQIAAEVPQVYFVISGEGVMRPQLEAYIRDHQLGDRVYLLGFTPDARALTNAFDLVAFPSFYEGMPIAILEAMALAKPIVATNVGGIPEEIEHGTSGWLVPARDSAALADGLFRLLRDRDLAHSLGQAAQARFYQYFTLQHMQAAYQEWYRS
jgi:glycosyltransferase involved in cell wall biosynthesis